MNIPQRLRTINNLLLTGALLIFFSTANSSESSDTSEFSKITECPRPEPGTYIGSCAARSGKYFIENSPFELHRWEACLQSKLGLPSGGYRDAVFFTHLIPEWEKEIEANLESLYKILSKKDQKVLKKEQVEWQLARERAQAKHSKQPQQLGTMYLMFGASEQLSFPENRAIELACRVEKLLAK